MTQRRLTPTNPPFFLSTTAKLRDSRRPCKKSPLERAQSLYGRDARACLELPAGLVGGECMAGGQVASGLSIDGEMGGEGLKERAGEEGQWPGPRGAVQRSPKGQGQALGLAVSGGPTGTRGDGRGWGRTGALVTKQVSEGTRPVPSKTQRALRSTPAEISNILNAPSLPKK